MKKIMLLCALAFLAFSNEGLAKSARTSQTVRVLRVATSGDYYPYTFCGSWDSLPTWTSCATGVNSPDLANLKGIDIETAQYLADQLGYKLELHLVSRSDIFTGLAAGDYDVTISSWGYSRDRLQYGYFTDPYSADAGATNLRLVGAKTLGNLDLTKMSGVSVAVTIHSLHEAYALANFQPQGAKVDSYADETSALNAVLAGTDQVNLTDASSLAGWFTANPNYGIVSTEIHYMQDGISQDRALILSHDPGLVQPINLALQVLQLNGGMQVIWNRFP